MESKLEVERPRFVDIWTVVWLKFKIFENFSI
jgi:hypothetical protein